MLKPISRQSVSDAVYQQLRDQILTGELAPGDTLPGERKLSEVFGVNRGAVREGLRRLAHAQLVAVQHGGSTRVLDFRDGGLDLLGELLLLVDGPVGIGFALDVLELREALTPLIARCAAERGGPAAADALAPIVADIEAAPEGERYPPIRAFWAMLSRHADNLALRLALNSLQKGTAARFEATRQILMYEIAAVSTYRRLAEAVGAADGDRAARIAADLVAPTLRFARQLSGSSTAS